jgi:lysine biosynthesis protein LysW
MATCPECDTDIEVDDTDLDEMEVGDPWDCESCGSHLRVGTLDPLEFDSDDDDDDDDDDDEADDRNGDDADDVEDDDEDDDDSDSEWND